MTVPELKPTGTLGCLWPAPPWGGPARRVLKDELFGALTAIAGSLRRRRNHSQSLTGVVRPFFAYECKNLYLRLAPRGLYASVVGGDNKSV